MKPKQIWTLAAFVLMFAIGAGTVGLGVLPNISQISVLEETRMQTREDNILKLTYLADLKMKAADKSALMLALEKKRQLVPSRLSNVEFMDELKTIADRRNVVVQKLSTTRPQQFLAPAPVKTNTMYTQAVTELGSNLLLVSNLSFSLQGRMVDIVNAIDDLNAGPRYVLITRVVVAKADGLGAAVVTGDLTGQIFTLSSE
jgi:hypothetical protein